MCSQKMVFDKNELISFCNCQIEGKKEEIKNLNEKQKFAKLILENEIETYNKIIAILRGE